MRNISGRHRNCADKKSGDRISAARFSPEKRFRTSRQPTPIFGAHSTFGSGNNNFSAPLLLSAISFFLVARHSLHVGWLTADHEVRAGAGALHVAALMVVALGSCRRSSVQRSPPARLSASLRSDVGSVTALGPVKKAAQIERRAPMNSS